MSQGKPHVRIFGRCVTLAVTHLPIFLSHAAETSPTTLIPLNLRGGHGMMLLRSKEHRFVLQNTKD